MPINRLLIPVAAVILVAAACTSYSQASSIELATRPARQGLETIDSKTTTLLVGPRSMEVPIKITWTRLKDKDCLRVGAIKVERTGGSDGVLVEAQIKDGVAGEKCATEMYPEPSAPEVRFDDAIIQFAWKARRGIKTIDSAGHPVLLFGDGRAKAEDNIFD